MSAPSSPALRDSPVPRLCSSSCTCAEGTVHRVHVPGYAPHHGTTHGMTHGTTQFSLPHHSNMPPHRVARTETSRTSTSQTRSSKRTSPPGYLRREASRQASFSAFVPEPTEMRPRTSCLLVSSQCTLGTLRGSAQRECTTSRVERRRACPSIIPIQCNRTPSGRVIEPLKAPLASHL